MNPKQKQKQNGWVSDLTSFNSVGPNPIYQAEIFSIDVWDSENFKKGTKDANIYTRTDNRAKLMVLKAKYVTNVVRVAMANSSFWASNHLYGSESTLSVSKIQIKEKHQH